MSYIRSNVLYPAAMSLALGIACDPSQDRDPLDPWHHATVTLPGAEEPVTVAYQVRDGLAIFEGDIILGEVDENGELLPRFRSLINNSARWPKGIVPYDIGDGVIESEVLNAIALWEEHTELRFVRDPHDEHDNRIDFVKGTDAGACSSALGMVENGQTISTTTNGGCGLSTMVHEIGHALGFGHEHNRGDRDDFITIEWDNIEDGRATQFCRKTGPLVEGDEALYCLDPSHNQFHFGPYDYESIMHYRTNDFGVEIDGVRQQTITPTMPASIRSSSNPSDGDVTAVESHYSFSLSKWDDFCSQNSEVCTTGDFNGDGNDDIVSFHRGSYGGKLSGLGRHVRRREWLHRGKHVGRRFLRTVGGAMHDRRLQRR